MKNGIIFCIIILWSTNLYSQWPTLGWPPLPLPPLQKITTKELVGYEQKCGQNGCYQVPIYKTIQKTIEPISLDEATKLLSQGGWSKEDSKRLEKIIDQSYISKIEENHRKLVKQEWDMASCHMLCTTHGSKLYDVYDDGTKELSKEQPIAPETGYDVNSWRPKVFGRRR